jgi:hypothetical protein
MRKLIVSTVIALGLLLPTASHAQVYNTAQKMKNGVFRFCIAPLILVENGDADPGMYLLGGVGLTRTLDLYLSTRVANRDRSNFGVGLQWAIVKGIPALSLTTGGHVGPDIGIDGTFDLSFSLGNSVVLYGGLDMDVDFHDNGTVVPAWIFIGPKVQIRRNTTLYLEIDIGMTEATPSILGLGLGFYL